MFRMLKKALSALDIRQKQLEIADVGASEGFDALYLLRRLTDNFRHPLPCQTVHLSLIEGDKELLDRGIQTLSRNLPTSQVGFKYYHHPLVKKLPLAEASIDVALCSEVVEHLERPGEVFVELLRVLKPGGFLIFTTDNSPNFFQRVRRLPVWLSGKYRQVYARPSLESVTVGHTEIQGSTYPIYGHINLNPTRVWEEIGKRAGFRLVDFGTYESIRRGGGSRSPLSNALYFVLGAIVYYLMPRRIGRFFGDTTALLWQKPKIGS
jgi:SAM-dependent methyltransferase